MKRKILTLGPVMPQESDIENIANTLSFLKQDYQIDYLDPLSIQNYLANEAYYQLWKNDIEKHLKNYDIFLGFSFGGVILQQCLSLFEGMNKRVILVSTPTFADKLLDEKLNKVVQLCEKKHLIKALNSLYKHVFFPNPSPLQFSFLNNQALIASRLIFGLRRVLMTNSIKILKESTVKHLHLIGEKSGLVNQANVNAPKIGQLTIVPDAGMRVVQDNPRFCQAAILEWIDSY